MKFICVDGGERVLPRLWYEGRGRYEELQSSLEVIEGCPVASFMHKVRLDNHSGPF